MKKVIFLIIMLFSLELQGQQVSKLDTIFNTEKAPFDNICFQQVIRKKPFGIRTSFVSTGFLIRRNIILTAGHNVYSNGVSKVENIKIFPGKCEGTTAYDPIEISGKNLCQQVIRVHPQYKFSKKDRIKWDFAVIIIPDSIIQRVSNWPTESAFSLDSAHRLKENDSIFVAGFPASGGYSGKIMTYQSGTCGNRFPNKFLHSFDTHTGNSGSPVWVERNGKRIIIGVHTFAGAATLLEGENIDYLLRLLSL